MTVCTQCGAELAVNASHCSACGAVTPRPANAVLAVARLPTSDDENVRLFVGKNYDYYRDNWAAIEQSKSRQSWNWAAFLLGFLWLLYRKMYRYGWVYLGMAALTILLAIVLKVPAMLSCVLLIAFVITCGRYGNHWYKLHVDKKVAGIRARQSPDQAQTALATQGGTDVGAVIVTALFLPFMFVGGFYLLVAIQLVLYWK